MRRWKPGPALRTALWILLALTVLPAGSAKARDLFEARIVTTLGGAPTSNPAITSHNEFLEIPELFEVSTLGSLFGGFDPFTQGFLTVLDVRGLPALLRWDEATSRLDLVIPGAIPAGAVFFDVPAGRLDLALDQLEDWFEGEPSTATAPQAFVTDFLQELVARSPVDPVAGNPNSLMSRMTAHDFQLGSEGPYLARDGRIPDGSDQTGLGLVGGYARGGSFDVETLELPLDHRFNLEGLPELSLLLSLPLTATWTEGRWSAMGSLGVGAQIRPFSWWALTPMLRVGSSGSVDVGAAALLYSATLTSNLHLDLGELFGPSAAGIAVHVVNQLGLAETVDGVQIGDFDLDYDLTNGVFRNGGHITAALGDSGWGLRVFGHDVRWAGDDLYLESHAELGAALLCLGNVSGFLYESLSLSASYLGDFGDYDGVSLTLRGRF